MKIAFQVVDHIDSFRKQWSWFILWGLCLLLLGATAIYLSAFTTVASIIFLGIIFSVVGVVLLVDTFKFWLHKGSSFFLHLILSLLYLAIGCMLVINPEPGAISLTFLLGIFFIVSGISRTIIAISLRFPRWGWMLSNGIITTILGILVLSQWPVSGLYIIGLFVGIDILLSGLSYIMLGIFAHTLTK